MDQVKIGQFIANQRKALGFTQLQLAEKINVSDRTVSKWERGVGLPDVSLMLPLCDALHISVNDLLCGEKMCAENIKEKTDENVINIIKSYKSKNRHIFIFMIVVFFTVSLFINVILADRYVTKQFMNSAMTVGMMLDEDVKSLEENETGMMILKENIPLLEDCISEDFELLKFPVCVLLINEEGVIAATDTDKMADDYQTCCEQAVSALGGGREKAETFASGSQFSYVNPFEFQGNSYVVSAYSSHNQLAAAVKSEFFLFAFLISGICFVCICLLYLLADKFLLSKMLK